MAFYPLVGGLIGAALAGVAWLLQQSGVLQTAPLLPAALVLAGWAALTGALHLDGWADCCDALFVPVEPGAPARDHEGSPAGSFGAAGLVLLLLVKLAALQGVAGSQAGLSGLDRHPGASAVGSGRRSQSLSLGAAGGMGDYFRRGLGRSELVIATVLRRRGSRAAALARRGRLGGDGAGAVGDGRDSRGRLGGLTGDVYGAIIELAETAALVAAAFTVNL